MAWRDNPRVGIVAAAAILLSLVVFWSLRSSSVEKPRPAEASGTVFICSSCNHEFRVRLSARRGEELAGLTPGKPRECPSCKQPAAYRAFACADPSCRNCGKYFLPPGYYHPRRDDPAAQVEVKFSCPVCSKPPRAR